MTLILATHQTESRSKNAPIFSGNRKALTPNRSVFSECNILIIRKLYKKTPKYQTAVRRVKRQNKNIEVVWGI